VADDINVVVFGEFGFQREIESTASRFFQLSSVLGDRRGSCLGLGALYLAIGERIGVPLDGTSCPALLRAHARTGPATTWNCSVGERPCPTEWYRKKYRPWPENRIRVFPSRHSVRAGLHSLVQPGQRPARGRGSRCCRAKPSPRAAQEFPGFAEAARQLGAAQQRRGAFAEAEASYRAAARAWPDLPGLAHNLELLQEQRDPDAAAQR